MAGTTYVKGLDTEDTDEGSLNLLELGVDLGLAERVQVRVRPGVRAESVALVKELTDFVDVVVDAVVVLTVEEEGGLATVKVASNVKLVDPGAVWSRVSPRFRAMRSGRRRPVSTTYRQR